MIWSESEGWRSRGAVGVKSKSKGRKNPTSQFKQAVRKEKKQISPSSTFAAFRPSVDLMMHSPYNTHTHTPPHTNTSRRAMCFTELTDSNVNLI